MANLGMNFDATAVEPDTGGRSNPIPEGRYVLQVVESDVVENSKGNGSILKLTLEVFDGPLTGRKLFENLNIQHANVQAQEIAQKQLSALCHAAGVTAVTDSAELHYQPFEADVGIEPESPKPGGGTYAAKNKITKYHFGEASAPAGKAPATRPAQTAAPAAAAKPWQRSKAA